MKKNSKRNLMILSAVAIAAPAVAPTFAHAQNAPVASKDARSQAALRDSSNLLLSLILATTKLEKTAGHLVAIDDGTARKYQSLRLAYLGSVPTTGVTSSATYLGTESVKRVEFVLAPLTALLRGVQKLGVLSLNGLDASLTVTGLDKVLTASSTQSGRSLEFTYEKILTPIIKLLVNKGTMLSSGASSTSSVAAGSLFFMMSDVNEAMTWDQVRSLLGQDAQVRDRIEKAVLELSEIFNLSGEQQAQLKVAIYDEAIRQAVAANFSADQSAYKLDVIQLMNERKIVDGATMASVNDIRAAVQELTKVTEVSDDVRRLTADNMDLALQLSALLEAQLKSGTIKDANVRAELERMLGSVAVKISLVSFNNR